MTKKFIISVLFVILMLALTACGDKNNTDETTTLADETTTANEEETASEGMNTVILTVGGDEKKVFTSAATVEEILSENNIVVDEDDIVEPEKSSAVTDGMSVVVKAVEVKNVTEKVVISFSTEKKYSDKMAKGTSKVEKQGVNGEKEVVYSVTYVDGKETEKTAVSEKITKQPVNAVVVYGTADGSNPTQPTEPTPTNPPVPQRPPVDLSAYDQSQIVSVQAIDDCDGSGHGYYMITLIDGSVVYQDY